MLKPLYLAAKRCQINLQNIGISVSFEWIFRKPPSIIWSERHEQRTKKQ